MRFVLILCVLIPRTSSAAEAQFRFRKDIDRKAAPRAAPKSLTCWSKPPSGRRSTFGKVAPARWFRCGT